MENADVRKVVHFAEAPEVVLVFLQDYHYYRHEKTLKVEQFKANLRMGVSLSRALPLKHVNVF